GDGSEVGSHASADGGGARAIPQGPGRAMQSPQTLRLVFSVARRVDHPEGDVHLRRRLLPFPARPGAAGRGTVPDAADDAGAGTNGPDNVFAVLDVVWIERIGFGIARLLCRRARARVLRLQRGRQEKMAAQV